MSWDIKFNELIDFSDRSDSSMPTAGALKAVLREHGKDLDGKLPKTTNSEEGDQSQISTTNIGSLLMGVPTYKDPRTTLMQQKYLLDSAQVATVASVKDGVKGIGGGFEDIVPSDLKAKAEALGPIDIETGEMVGDTSSGEITEDNVETASGATVQVGTGVGYEDVATRSNTGPHNVVDTTKMRHEWGRECYGGALAQITLHGGIQYSYRPAISKPVLYLANCLAAANYKSIESGGGAFNCRNIGHVPMTPGNIDKRSLHSFGIAFDINPTANPQQSTFKTDMPAKMVANIKSLKTVDGIQVWRWGGDYRTSPDAMHFEIGVTAAELNKGLDPRSMKV